MVIIVEGLRREDWAKGGGQCTTSNGQDKGAEASLGLLALTSGVVSGQRSGAGRRRSRRRGGNHWR